MVYIENANNDHIVVVKGAIERTWLDCQPDLGANTANGELK